MNPSTIKSIFALLAIFAAVSFSLHAHARPVTHGRVTVGVVTYGPSARTSARTAYTCLGNSYRSVACAGR